MMEKDHSWNYKAYWFTALFLQIYGAFGLPEAHLSWLGVELTRQIFIEVEHIFTPLVALFGFYGLLNYLLVQNERKLFKLITNIHCFGSLILYCTIIWIISQVSNHFCATTDLTTLLFFLIRVFLILQFLYLVNLVTALINKRSGELYK